MSTAKATRVVTPPAPGPTSDRPFRRLAGTGLLAVTAAVVVTTLAAALARAGGVDLDVGAGEAIPVSGIAFVTGVFSTVGVVMAAGFLRWSARPHVWFVRTTVPLTALSLVPPVLVDADAATTGTLVGLHLLAAAVMIPTLARTLHGRST